MNRLPDRPEYFAKCEKKEKKDSKGKTSFKDNLGMYGALFVIVVLIFILTQKVQVPYDEMTITSYTPKTDGSSFFVVGKLEEGQRFAGSKVDLNEETGVAEIIVYRYGLPTVFGSQDFVVIIDAPEDEVNEIWLSCTDSDTQQTVKTQLSYKQN